MTVGSRVKRRKEREFDTNPLGTIVGVTSWGTYIIKWDIKASNGQQHSTVNGKFLVDINAPIIEAKEAEVNPLMQLPDLFNQK